MEEIRQLLKAESIVLRSTPILRRQCQALLQQEAEQKIRPHDEPVCLRIQLIGCRRVRVLPDGFVLHAALTERLLPLQHLPAEALKFRQQRRGPHRICRHGLIHQLNSALALIARLQPDAQQRTDGIKETAAARGSNGVQIPVMEHKLGPQGILVRQPQLPHDFLGPTPGHEAADIGIQTVRGLFQTVDHGHRDAPALPGGRVPADLQEGLNAGGPAEMPVVRNEHFTAPDAAVGAVARAVQGNADDRLGMVIFRHAGNDVGIMMLNPQQRQSPRLSDLLCHSSGIVARMQVAGDDCRLRLQQGLHALYRFPQGVTGAEIREISHIAARVEKVAHTEAEGVFQLSADGQHLPLRSGCRSAGIVLRSS